MEPKQGSSPGCGSTKASSSSEASTSKKGLDSSCSKHSSVKGSSSDGKSSSCVTDYNTTSYHTTTFKPVESHEVEEDSEEEYVHEWLEKSTVKIIDEFTDINDGEKALMKMWDIFMIKKNFVNINDCQVYEICKEFVNCHWQDILEQNLYRNFILHLTNLYDFGVLSPLDMFTTVEKLQAKMNENGTSSVEKTPQAKPQFFLKEERPTAAEEEAAINMVKANVIASRTISATATIAEPKHLD